MVPWEVKASVASYDGILLDWDIFAVSLYIWHDGS